MKNPAVTVELPNGTRKAIRLTGLHKEISRLANASAELGYELALSITTTSGARFKRTLRLDPVQRESHEPAPPVINQPAEKKLVNVEKQRRAAKKQLVDVEKLRRAMDQPGFSGTSYANKHGVSSSLVFYHIKKIQTRAKKKK